MNLAPRTTRREIPMHCGQACNTKNSGMNRDTLYKAGRPCQHPVSGFIPLAAREQVVAITFRRSRKAIPTARHALGEQPSDHPLAAARRAEASTPPPGRCPRIAIGAVAPAHSGTGPVEASTWSSGGSSRSSPASSRPSRQANSASTAATPISCAGWRTVVNGTGRYSVRLKPA